MTALEHYRVIVGGTLTRAVLAMLPDPGTIVSEAPLS